MHDLNVLSDIFSFITAIYLFCIVFLIFTRNGIDILSILIPILVVSVLYSIRSSNVMFLLLVLNKTKHICNNVITKNIA